MPQPTAPGRLAAITDRLLGRKESATVRLVVSGLVGGNQPVWTPRNYKRLAKEGYEQNTWAYACIAGISRACKGVPWVAYQGAGAQGKQLVREIRANGRDLGARRLVRHARERKELVEVTSHPMLQLLARPNSEQGGGAFMEAVIGYWLCSGNSYIESVPGASKGRPPLELWPLRPDRVEVIPDAQNRVSGYKFTAGSGSLIFPFEDVLQMRFWHPTNDWYGLSPIEAAAKAIDRDNAAEAWNTALLQNGARPSGALISTVDISEQQRADLKAALDDRSNPQSAGRPLLLEGGLDWKEMGLTPKDMDWLQAQEWSLKRIAAAFGYPILLLDPDTGGSFSTDYGEARKALYQDTVLPLMDHLRDDLNNWLTPLYGENLLLDYAVDEIEALQEDRNQAWSRTNDVRMTLDERRVAVGLDELPNGTGNVILLPVGTVAQPAGEPWDSDHDTDTVVAGGAQDDDATGAGAPRKAKAQADQPAAGGATPPSGVPGVPTGLPPGPPDWWLQGAEQWMIKQTGLRVTQVTATTRAVLAGIITDGVQEGLSMQQIAAKIRSAYQEFGQARALLIARTEVIAAANAGGRYAALATGLTLEKEWLATLDNRTRPDHADAEGQRRKMDEHYSIGGYPMLFPGDPEGPPQEVINCRCTEVYFPVGKAARSHAWAGERRAAWWQGHDESRQAWEDAMDERARKLFVTEGDHIATAVSGAGTEADALAAAQPDTEAWQQLYQQTYRGVMGDFGGRVHTALTTQGAAS